MLLYKRPQRDPWPLLPCGVKSKKRAVYETGSRPSPDTEPAGTLMLNFPGSRTEKYIFVVYKPPSLWFGLFFYSGLNGLRQTIKEN